MSDVVKKPGPGDEPILSVRNWQLEATTSCVHSPSSLEVEELGFLKPMQDLAFAVAIRDSGGLTEGQLALATRDWTVFGTKTLASHLVVNGFADNTQVIEIQRRADHLYEQASIQTPSASVANSERQSRW